MHYVPTTVMADYLDVGHNLQQMLTDLRSVAAESSPSEKAAIRQSSSRGPVDPNAFLRVRESVCVVGFDRQAVARVKNQVGGLLEEPFPIEGFHATCPADLKDGALLVPKLLMVARHCPGRKVLDEAGDEGQLDHLYDEAVNIRADVMLVYIDLPRSIYKPMRHMVHHPKLAEMVYPTQPLLRHLAANNCLVTVTEKSELNNMQKNVIREWLVKPVSGGHPVYKAADNLSTLELSRSGIYDFNKSGSPRCPPITYYRPQADQAPDNQHPCISFQPATEQHPLAETRRKKRKKKEKKENREQRATEGQQAERVGDLMDFEGSGAGVELSTLQQGRTNYGAFSKGQTYDDFV